MQHALPGDRIPELQQADHIRSIAKRGLTGTIG